MIICEIGLNHLGKEDYADEYIDAIVKSRADALTFQVREKEYYERPEKAYLKLSNDYYKKAFEKTKAADKKFGIALADERLVGFFAGLRTDFYKVLSKDISNFSLLDKLAQIKKPVFASTGMSNLEEIEKLVKRFNVKLIHTQLSHNIEDVNLAAIPFLREKFDLPVAFGSHCPNSNVLLMSLVYSPSDIFFYIKGKRTEKHPDEEHAVCLDEMEKLINNLIELPKAIGRAVKIKTENLIK